MLKKKMPSFKKLARVKTLKSDVDGEPESPRESLLRESEGGARRSRTPSGFLAVYVGDECRRFVVPTSFLSHPLFRMLLDKAYREFGFDQKSGLVVPCSVCAFLEIMNTVEANNGRFNFGELVEEFL